MRQQAKRGALALKAPKAQQRDTKRTRKKHNAASLQGAQVFSFPLDYGILRIGGVAFLLDYAKVAFDQVKWLAFPFKFAAQALAKRSAFSMGQFAKINSRAPPLRLDPPDALSEEQAFDAVDMASALPDQARARSVGTASVILFDSGHANDGAHVALATLHCDEGSQ